MVLSGGWLVLTLILLSLWFALLCRCSWKLLKARATNQPGVRNHLTLAAIGFSTVAVGSLLALHLSWVSPAISQHLGATAISVLSVLLFWPPLTGLLLNPVASWTLHFTGV